MTVDLLKRFVSFWETPHRLLTAGVLRVGLGTMSLLFFASHYSYRAFVWGPSGLLDWQFFRTHGAAPFNVYSLSGSAAWSELLFWLSIVASLGLILGILPRLMCVATFLLLFGAFNRTWVVIDGGHNILQLLMFYVCFADLRSGALFAPDILTSIMRTFGMEQSRILFGETAYEQCCTMGQWRLSCFKCVCSISGRHSTR